MALYAMAVPDDLREASRAFGSEFWSALCVVTPDLAGYSRLVLMWVLMSAAMMLPTALPTFRAYTDLGSTGAETRLPELALGFLLIWAAFSLLAAGLQLALFQSDLVSSFGDSRSSTFSAVLLLIAGFYQFSTAKASCLSKCRAPVAFFLEHWGAPPFQLGLRMGATCLGCCWALMLLAFVGGTMNLLFMGLATLVMTLEKLPQIGRLIDRPLGYALIAGAALMALSGI